MSIRSEEVNYLIFRYLQESGFEHTAFAFAYESRIAETRVFDEYVPPGALITFLQKALQYIELESHVRDDSTEVDCNVPFSLIYPHKCSNSKKDHKNNLMDVEIESKDFLPSKVQILEGHTKTVYSCSWSPSTDTLATGAGDSSVRLWKPNESSELGPGPELMHSLSTQGSNDITAISWNNDGSLLASSSYNGEVKIWSNSGMSVASLPSISYPIFDLSFAPSSNNLLITGALPSFYIYNLADPAHPTLQCDVSKLNEWIRASGNLGEYPMNNILLHSLWRDDCLVTFVDNTNRILNVRLNETPDKHPVQILIGHEGEIGTIDWTMDKKVLISGGDDGVIKLWNEDRNESLFDFLSHTAVINQVLASHRSANHFFSCSNDRTVKIFDIQQVSTVSTLSHHDGEVTHLAESTNDSLMLLASSGLDRMVYFTDLRTKEPVKKHHVNSDVFDMAFSREGNRLSVATMDSQVIILDLRV